MNVVANHEISVLRAAELLRCSEQTVRRLLEAGDLEGYRMTARGHWRIDKESVLRYMDRLHRNRQ